MSSSFKPTNELDIPFSRNIDFDKVFLSLLNKNNTNISLSKIGSGNVEEEKFNFLSGLTGNIQDQLDRTITETSVNILTNKTINYDDNNLVGVEKTINRSSDPITTDDTASKYNYGSIIVNNTTDSPFICIDPTVGNAKWLNLNEKRFFFIAVSGTTTYKTAVTWIAGDRAYNTFDIVFTSSNASCRVRIFNETTGSALVESNIISGTRQITTLVSPNKYLPSNTLLSLQVINGIVETMTTR